MNSPLPLSELPMAATAVVFKGPQPNGSVVVSTLIGAGTLPLEERDGAYRNNLELALVAVNQSGKTFSGGRNTLDLNMQPDTAKRAAVLGFRVISTIDLPPGRYTLRVGARENNTKKAGSVSYDAGGAGLHEGEAADEQSRAHVGGQLRVAHGAREGSAASSSCPARSPRTASSRRPTSWRSSPRSTTTTATSHTR